MVIGRNRESETWRHASVRAFAVGQDPVQLVRDRARSLVLDAMDRGWSGPPFDPFALAAVLDIRVRTSPAVRDARLLAEDDRPVVEYNPTRPPARVRYSVAHECAHTLFPDWADRVRHRAAISERDAEDWELESLCNIGAAEFLMPYGSLPATVNGTSAIDELLAARNEFQVSAEAMFLRTVELAEVPCGMFVARPSAETYIVEYAVASPAMKWRLKRGQRVPVESVLTRCTGIGYTAKAVETWLAAEDAVRLEAVGIPGFPGASLPRVLVWVRPVDDREVEGRVEYLRGDATEAPRAGAALLVHVVPNSTVIWGGRGFAAAVRRAYPEAQSAFREWRLGKAPAQVLGQVHVVEVSKDFAVASIVAQEGHGPSVTNRLRYAALRAGLEEAARLAAKDGRDLRLPRIGTGHAGGRWEIIEEMLVEVLRKYDLRASVVELPSARRTA